MTMCKHGKLPYNTGSSACDKLQGWDGMGGGRKVQGGGNIYIPMTGSFWCMAETNTAL